MFGACAGSLKRLNALFEERIHGLIEAVEPVTEIAEGLLS